ncbi:MAG: hypothetical protein JNL74_07045 [Fibrobacteres bacterium]|nr:hypothetical protein [Fibrobacterota bacterium]
MFKVFMVVLLAIIPAFAGKFVILYSDLGAPANEKLGIMFRQIGGVLSSTHTYEVESDHAQEHFLSSVDSLTAHLERKGAQRIAALSINVLSPKVFYNIIIIDAADKKKVNSFRFVAMTNEDFEVIINRLSKMLGNNEAWVNTENMDDIALRDTQKRRQKNNGRTAFYMQFGIMSPLGESLRRQASWHYDTTFIQPDRFMNFGLGISYDVRKYFIEADYELLGFSGMSFGIGGGYFLRDASIAPYVGLSLSATWLYNTVEPDKPYQPDTTGYYFYNEDYDYDFKDDVGFSVMPRLGVKALRDHSFQPFFEIGMPIVLGSKRIEKIFGARLGFAYAF